MAAFIDGKLDVQPALDSLMHLKDAMQRKIIGDALEVAATPMKAAAKAVLLASSGGYYGTPGRETKTLLNSLTHVRRSYPQKNLVVVVIGPQNKGKVRVPITPDRMYRQVGGTRANAAMGIKGVFGVTKRIFNSKPQYLHRDEDPAKIAHLVERGSKNRKSYPFLSIAYRQTKAECEARFATRVAEGVAKEVAGMYIRAR